MAAMNLGPGKGRSKGDLAPKARKITYGTNKEQALVSTINRANSADFTNQAFANNGINKVENIGLKTAAAPAYKTGTPITTLPVVRTPMVDDSNMLAKYGGGTKGIKGGKVRGDTSDRPSLNPNTRPSYHGDEYIKSRDNGGEYIGAYDPKNKFKVPVTRAADGSDYWEPLENMKPKAGVSANAPLPGKVAPIAAPAPAPTPKVGGRQVVRIPSENPKYANMRSYDKYKVVDRTVGAAEEDYRVKNNVAVKANALNADGTPRFKKGTKAMKFTKKAK